MMISCYLLYNVMFKSKKNRSGWRHAFALNSSNQPLTDFERALVDRLGKFIVDRGLCGPAIMLLESCRPLNFVGSQLLAFFSPFLSLVFSSKECDCVVRLLERRESIDHILDAIGRGENETSVFE